jgi:ribosomal protein S12 methylthiotransferase
MKVGFVSLGCPKNLVDSEVMMGLAEQAGHALTPDAALADVLVVNTCAFIDRAKQESIDAILEMAAHKEQGPCKRLIVTGCLAERYRDELRKEMPEIDAVLGTGEVEAIVSALENRAHRGPPPTPAASEPAPARLFGRDPNGAVRERPLSARHRDRSAPLPTYLYDASTPRRLTTPGHYAYVKVAEGCDYNCAFCIIPALRGPYRSRAEASILDEARRLAKQGVKELLLISQDTTFYGLDRKDRGALARLLRSLNEVHGLEWIRLLYLYPTTITRETLDAMADCEKVCKYIDLPLQHASDRVLQRMRRPGSRRTYETLLANIRERMPEVALRTTFIVGFPGETEADFRELCDFVRTVRFEHVGVFTYSHEEGTAAGAFEDDVPAAVKARRQRTLMSLQKRLVARRNARRVGEHVRVMVDGPSAEHQLVLQGRLASQAPDIDPVVYLTGGDPSIHTRGTFVDGKVVGARGYDLIVQPLGESSCLDA